MLFTPWLYLSTVTVCLKSKAGFTLHTSEQNHFITSLVFKHKVTGFGVTAS